MQMLTPEQERELEIAHMARRNKLQVEVEIMRAGLQEWVNSLRSVSPAMRLHIMRRHAERFTEQWERDNPPPQPPRIQRAPTLTGLN